MRNRVMEEARRMQKYEELEVEVIRFDAVDVITASGDTTTESDGL